MRAGRAGEPKMERGGRVWRLSKQWEPLYQAGRQRPRAVGCGSAPEQHHRAAPCGSSWHGVRSPNSTLQQGWHQGTSLLPLRRRRPFPKGIPRLLQLWRGLAPLPAGCGGALAGRHPRGWVPALALLWRFSPSLGAVLRVSGSWCSCGGPGGVPLPAMWGRTWRMLCKPCIGAGAAGRRVMGRKEGSCSLQPSA